MLTLATGICVVLGTKSCTEGAVLAGAAVTSFCVLRAGAVTVDAIMRPHDVKSVGT